MKHLITVLLICWSTILIAQPCLPEGITFATQEEIDNFQINYPDCTEIEGDVTVHAIDNLAGLNCLTSIGGNLTLEINANLTNLDGLNNVNSIGGNLILEINTNLTNLYGLNNLISIGGNLIIAGNPALNDLTGLNKLEYITGKLGIYQNENLVNLNGLDSLSHIGGSLHIGKFFMGNPSLNSLAGLDKLTTIGESIILKENHALTTLSGLNNLISIGGSLGIYRCFDLSELIDLESLNFIGGWISINQCHALSNLFGLESITQVEGIQIAGNQSSLNLSGLDNIYSVEKDIWIAENLFISNLVGLDNLNSIGQHLIIYGNESLANLDGLNNLSSIGGNLEIGRNDQGDNPSLISLEALSNLSFIGGGLLINHCNNLTSLLGLENIDSESIDSLYIYENEALTDCNIFSICEYITNSNSIIEIHDNSSGCNNPEEIEEACLTDIEDLSRDTKDFEIFPNPTNKWIQVKSLNPIFQYNIEIRNLMGQIVKEENNIKSQQYTMNIADLEAGVYFYMIKEKGEVVQQGKIIKK